MATLDQTDPRSLLADFDAARNALLQAFSAVPDAALSYRPEGDDYALSGLLIHVAGVLEHYAHVLDAMVRSDFGPVVVDGAPDAADLTLVHDGVPKIERYAALARVAAGHRCVSDLVRKLNQRDLQRQASVRFGAGADPLPTSALDIVGWTRDHYYEHVGHIAELLERWRTA